MNEAEYRDAHKLIESQITGAARVFYTYLEIQKIASEGGDNFRKIQQDGHFWTLELYALQCTTFIILGRLFDKRTDVYSIPGFLDDTVKSRDLFSKAALKERKRDAVKDGPPGWLEDLLSRAHEPTDDDFNKLTDAFEAAKKEWQLLAPIRHKVFAHTDRNALDANFQATLFENTTIVGVEDILNNLMKIRLMTWELLENGRLRWIADDYRTYADVYINDARQLFGHIHIG
ncbi:MAG TPA: hypothetical protein VHY35_10410 [Stellaceae bacterium]|jgi:hypothetical protein|nr:hypothetical protein [Stellaceae bacterium]